MRNIRWQLIIAIGGLTLIFGYLLGQAPVLEPAAPEPISGGIYREALVGMVSRLNPILENSNQADQDINRLLYRGLVRFDYRGIPQPDLAESWAVSADATLYTFTLKKDLVWHDQNPLRSDDIVYTFSKFQDEDYPGPSDLHQFWSQINIMRLDERTVQFQLPEPFSPFLDYVSVGLVPEHILRGVSAGDLVNHPFNVQPIGSGPFRFERFILEEDRIKGVSLIAFEDYYQGSPFLDVIEIRFYEDEGQALQAYLNEEVQGISRVSERTLERVLELPDLNLHSSRLPTFTTVFVNLLHDQKTFLSEKEIRQALSMAINRQWIIDEVLSGQGIVTYGPILSGTWAYLDSITPPPFDPKMASQLLEDLGWTLPEGVAPASAQYIRSNEETPLAIDLLHADDSVHTAIANALKESWNLIGVQVTLVPVSGEELISEYLEPRRFEALLTELELGPYPDPDPYPFWHDSQTEGGQNYSGFADRNIGIWLERARTTPDLATRAELYKSFQFRFNDQLPAFLLFSPVYTYAIDSQIQGVSIGPIYDPSDRFDQVSDWYIRFRRSSASEATEAR